MSGEARDLAEPDLTRGELYGWLARLYQRYQDDQANEEPECDVSKDSE